MTTKKITFDPDAGASYSANFTMLGGANFEGNFEIVGTSNTSFNLEGYSGSSQMTKSVSIGSTAFPTATFAVGFTSAVDGRVQISLGGTQTKNISEGRYVYDVIISSGSTYYSLVNGNILVRPGVSSNSSL